MTRSLALSTLYIAASALLTSSAMGGSSVSIKDVKLGTHVYGPDLKLEDLEGRVILYEFWGLQ